MASIETLARRDWRSGNAGRMQDLPRDAGPVRKAVRAAGSNPNKLLIEPLEPRLLLSADVLALDLSLGPDSQQSHSLLVRQIEETRIVGEQAVPVQQVQIVDDNTGLVLAFGDRSEITSIVIKTGAGGDSLTVDLDSFGDVLPPLPISFDGGDGSDRLVVETATIGPSPLLWTIDGHNSGTVTGPLNVEFSHVENLAGADDIDDTFVVTAAGRLDGLLDAGAHGFDSLEVEGTYNAVTATLDRERTTLDLDGTLLTYKGLEPVLAGGGQLQLAILGTAGNDEVVLEEGPAPGLFQIRSANGSFATQIISPSIQTVVLGLSTGADSFTSTLGSENPFIGNILIGETADLTLGNLTGIDGSFSVSTISKINIAADDDDPNWDGSSITISDNAVISITGDFALTVNAYDVLDASNLIEWVKAAVIKGSISVGQNVTLNARDVTMEVATSNERKIFVSIDATTLVKMALDDAKVAEAVDWGSLTLVNNGNGTATFTRTGLGISGNGWIADGFKEGHQLLLFKADGLVNQSFRVIDVSASKITVELADGVMLPASSYDQVSSPISITGYAFVRLTGNDQIVFGVTEDSGEVRSVIVRQVPVENPDARMSGMPSLNFGQDGNDSKNIITRATGSWIADGFAVGQTIEISGAGTNNGVYVIEAASATVLKLTGMEEWQQAGSLDGVEIRGHQLGSFVDDGFQVGDLIVVQNSEFNDKTYTIAEITENMIVLESSDLVFAEYIDLSSATAPQLVIQKVNEDIALEELPLVLLDGNGQTVKNADGTPLSFTVQELEAAGAAVETELRDGILTYLVDNPVLDFLTGFGMRILGNDASASISIGGGTNILATGDVSLVAGVEAEVDGSTPSVVAGISVVSSKVSATIDIAAGVNIHADDDIDIAASTLHRMKAEASVTSGSIINPLQSAREALVSDTYERTLGQVDPTAGAVFSFLQGLVPAMSGFVRVPGPSIAVALGIADTTTKVTIHDGSSIAGGSVTISAENGDPEEDDSTENGESEEDGNTENGGSEEGGNSESGEPEEGGNKFNVGAISTIFQPGANQGYGVAVAISVNISNAIVEIAGDVSTHEGSGGTIDISASSINEENGVSASAWVREVQEGSGQGTGDLLNVMSGFSEKIKSFQNDLRSATEIGNHINENPGQLSIGAGVAVLYSSNTAEVKISSKPDSTGAGGIRSDGDLIVTSYAEQNPSIVAAGATEPGTLTAISGGIAFARFDNTAATTLETGAYLSAQGKVTLTSEALIPNPFSLPDLLVLNFEKAQKDLDKALAEAADEPTETLRLQKEAEARAAYNEAISKAVMEVVTTVYEGVANRFWGLLGGFEGFLLTSYVNSGTGGDWESNDPAHKSTKYHQHDGTPQRDEQGNIKQEVADYAKQSANYSVSGNISILEIHNKAETVIKDGSTIKSAGALQVDSTAGVETVNLTGLTSIWDILKSLKARNTGDDGGASTSGAEGGFGANVAVRVFENTARTKVQSGASLTSSEDSVSLTAKAHDLYVNMHEIASDGGAVSVSGSVAVDVLNSTTEVLVDESVRISAGTDILLDADSDHVQVNVTLAGSESKKPGSVAVGAAIGVNVVTSTTRAEIANLDTVVPVADNSGVIQDPESANINAGGSVTVRADRQETVVQIAIAGSSRTTEQEPEEEDPDSIYDGISDLFAEEDPDEIYDGIGQLFDETPEDSGVQNKANTVRESGNGNGVSIAGAALVDVSTATVTARAGAGSSIKAGGAVKVLADFSRDAVFVDGGGVLDRSADKNGGKLALAGAFGIGVATRNVDALVDSAIIRGGALEVLAGRKDVLVAVSLGGAGATRTNTVVAGSVNVTVLGNSVHARVTDSHVEVDSSVLVKATSDTTLVTIAGAIGVVVDGDTGIGAAIAVSYSGQEVHAYIDNSIVHAGGDVIVHAWNKLDLISLSASAGVAISGVGLSGQLSLHLVKNDVDARIGAGSDVEARNNVAVLADDSITMVTVAGGVAIGNEGAFGAALSSTNIFSRKVAAHVDNGASVTAFSEGDATEIDYDENADDDEIAVNGITVRALADDDVINLVVGVAIAGQKFAGQGSVLVDTNKTEVLAYIGTSGGTAGNFATAIAEGGGDVVVGASYDFVGVNIVGGLAIAGSELAAGASVNVSIHHRTVNADIGEHAFIEAGGSVIVDADLNAVLRTVVFTGAFSGVDNAFAGAISVAVMNDFVTAQAMSNATVKAGDDIVVDADHRLAFTIVDVAAAAGAENALGASIGVVIQNATTKALVGAGAKVTAQDTIVVDATGTAAMQNIAGGINASGQVSVGGSGFILVRNDTVTAEIGAAAAVTALALGSGFVRTKASRDDGDPNTPPETETVSGVGMYAQSWEELVGIAVQGGVSGSLTFAGSLPVTVIKETTTATIGKGAQINISDQAAGEDQDVIVRAKDDTLVVNIAGNVAISSSGSLGGTVDVAALTKTTSAVIEKNTPADLTADAGAANVFANRNIRVEAEGNDNLVSVVAGISGAATAALGINASIYVLDIDTTARIGAGATVVAEGSVIVDAAHRTETDHILGTVTVSGVAAASGGAVVVAVDKTVHAVIDESASVAGKGLHDGLSDIRTGRIIEDFRGVTENPVDGDSDEADGFEFSLPDDQPDGSVNYSAPQIKDDEGSTKGMFVARDFRAELLSDTGAGAAFRGVSVTATNVDDLMTIAGAVSASGAASISGTAAVSVVKSNVEASVRNGAEINADNGSHGGEQSVQIAAGNAFDHLGVVVAAGGSGGATVLPAAHILVGDLTTKAAVEGASVNANRNIAVRADAHEDMQSVGFLIAGSAAASIAPTLSTAVLTSKTTASVTGDARLNSAGNILIGASDDTNVDVVEVALAGAGGFALGAAISVVDVQKTTEAVIGAGAAVDARASTGGAMPALTGEQVCLDTESMRGVLVDARSSEDIDVVTFGLGGGAAGFAGSLGRQTVDADTIAGIHGGAKINADENACPIGEHQSVYVSAYNKVDLRGIAAGGAFGIVAGAAGVNVADLRNDTTAFIAGEVNAQDRVSITALSDQDVNGIVFAGAAGGGSLSGAVGVFGIGGNIDSNKNLGFSYADGDGQQQSGTALDGDQQDNVDGSHRTPDNIKGKLWGDSGEQPVKPAADTFASVKTSFSDLDLSRLGAPTEQFSQTSEQPFERGTTAFVGRNASIDAGKDVDIDARQNSNVTVVAGGIAAGALGATGGIGIVNMGNNVSAFLADNATISAGNLVSISADLAQHVQVTSYAGSATLALALSAGVTSINDTSNVSAYVGNNAEIKSASDIVVEANSNITLLGQAIGLSASLGISGAAAVVFISTEGGTEAYAGENVRIGQTPSDGQGGDQYTVDSLSITATSNVTIDAPSNGQGKSGVMALGGSLGGAAVAAGDAHVSTDRTTAAHVGAGSDICVNDSIRILADSTSLLSAKAIGGAGGLFALGMMSSRAVLNSATSAEIRGSDNRRTSIIGGGLQIDSSEKAVVMAEAVSGSVALAGGRGAFANAILTASSHAGIGQNVDVLTTGDVDIRAHSAVEGDSTARAGGGGAIDVGYSEARTFINPGDPQNPEAADDADDAPVMNMAFVNSGTIIVSGGNVNIRAVADANKEPYSPIIGEIDPDTDTIKLNNEHGLSTGDLIQYKGTQGATIGLEQDRDYRVIRFDADFIQLGESFKGSLSGEVRVGLDPEFDVIRFGSAHSFKDGDRVRYVAPEPYFINKGAIVNDQITIPEHGLQTGDAIRWGREPDAETFYVIVVDANTIAFAATQDDAKLGNAISMLPYVINKEAIVNDQITILQHGLQAGDAIRWRTESGAETFYVIVVDANTIAFAATQADAELGNAIAIPVIDDQVSYELTPQLPTGLVDGAIYTVNVIDEFSIKLISDSMTVRPSHDFGGTSVSNGTFSIDNHGFNNGDAVTYNGPDVFPVTVNHVGVRYGPFDHDGDAATPDVAGYFHDDTGLILLPGIADGEDVVYRAGQSAETTLSSDSVNEIVSILGDGIIPKIVSTITIDDHGFATGQKVTYHQGANFILGLTDNADYYVIKVNDNEIRLADSLQSAVGLFPDSISLSVVGDDDFQFSFSYAKSIPGLTDGETYRMQKLDHDLALLWWFNTPIEVSHEGMQPGEIHNFYRKDQFPLPGLVDGKTYYVVNATEDTFQLSETPEGPALNISGAGIAGTQNLSIAGIDMNRGWGSSTLVIDLENDGTGELRSEGGGDLREIVKILGNGISEAVAEGFGFALGSIVANESKVDANASVLVNIDDAQIATNNEAKGGDISVLAVNHLEGKASAKTFSIGLFTSNKLSVAIAEIHDKTRIDISGGTHFSAAGDILVKTESAQVFNARSETEGGGAEERARSNAAAIVTVDNSINILDGSDLLAAGELTVHGYTGGTADFFSKVKNGGLGALAYANRTLILAPYINQIWGAHHTSNTRITIGDFSNLAGSKSRIEAEASNIKAKGKSDVHTGGLGTDADADSRVTLTADALIEIGALAKITGTQGVVIRAKNRGNTATSTATATSISLTGGTDTNARAQADFDATIKAADAAVIYAGTGPSDVVALLVEAVEELNTVTATAPSTKGLLDTGTKIETPDKGVESTIVWDADVRLQGGAPYRLVIDEKGEIEIAENVSASTETGEIYVDDILVSRSRVGQVHFIASGSTGTESITGQDGTFYLLNNLNSVSIENRSELDLVVQNIGRDPAGSELSEDWNDVVIDSDLNGLMFSLSGYDALDVNIHNLTESDVYIKGTIDNPYGSTTIRNEGGDIRSWGDRYSIDFEGRTALIVTSGLDLNAPLGLIGASGRPLNVDMVRFDGVDPAIDVDAGSDIHIDLKIRERIPVLAEPYPNLPGSVLLNIRHIQSGGDVNIVLQEGAAELVQLSLGPVRVLSANDGVKDDSLSGHAFSHYRNDFVSDLPSIESQESASPRDMVLLPGSVTSAFYVLQDAESVNDPAVLAGGNISISAASIGAVSDPLIFLAGQIDLGPDGILNVLTSGFVNLIETAGNLNVGRVESRYSDVILTANTGSILDADEDAYEDVIGTGVTLNAEQGAIGAAGETGSQYRSLDIDSRASLGGSAIARALGDVFLIETGGNINVKEIHSEGGDVRLATVQGSINDASSFATGTVQGTNVDLIASGGGIGAADWDFRIDSSTSSTGRLFAAASSGIFISEVAGSLHVLRAEATNGSVRLRTPDTTTSGEDFILLSNGSSLLGEEFDQGLIAAGRVTLEIGDNVTTQDNSEIRAEERIIVRGDHGNSDAGTGTAMDLRGSFIAPLITFYGNADDDRFTFNQTYLGGETFAYGGNAASLGHDSGDAPQGNDGGDEFVINQLKTMPGGANETLLLSAGGRPTLNLDGQSGSDTYLIGTNGSGSLDSDYVINVIDTGALGDGVNTLRIEGTEEDGDLFLLRKTIDVNVVNKAHGMVALLHGTLAQSIANGAARPQTVERINYSANISGGLTVAGLGGDDVFVTDDNLAITTLDGGEGDDLFQIGQLFGTPRLNPDGSGTIFEGITDNDQFVTQLTTNGWLSRGATFEMRAVGGAGDDCFSIFSHSAPLHIDAGEGNDSVAISTFRLVDPSVEATIAGASRDEIAATLAQEHAKILPYNVNAAMTVDGGNGIDRVTVVRSHQGATFQVLDVHEILGAGLSVSIAETESTSLSSRCADQCGLDLALVLPGETNPPPFDYCRGPVELDTTIIPEPTVFWTLPQSLPTFANNWQPGDLRVSIAPLSSFPPPDIFTSSSRREVVPGAGPSDDATEPPSDDATELQSKQTNPNPGADGDYPEAEQGNGGMPGVGDARAPGAGVDAGGCCDCEEDDKECLQQCEDYKERCCSDGEGQNCKEDCPCQAPCQNGEQKGVSEPSGDRSSLESEPVLAALVLPAALTDANIIQLLSPRTVKTGRGKQTEHSDAANDGQVWIEELGGFVRLDELERHGVFLRAGESWFGGRSERGAAGESRPDIARKSVINWSRQQMHR